MNNSELDEATAAIGGKHNITSDAQWRGKDSPLKKQCGVNCYASSLNVNLKSHLKLICLYVVNIVKQSIFSKGYSLHTTPILLLGEHSALTEIFQYQNIT